ncbi:hypothetical protein SNEBB_006846 [Seison nebaliae]|nr:hypothetical protein SNEBB_006846 [Seison nebaliae]
MSRRDVRLRREYIYKKLIDGREKEKEEKKRLVEESLLNNQKIPAHLRDEAIELSSKLDWNDSGATGIKSGEDDEYRLAGVEDPSVVITTSRYPSSRLKQFAKEMKLLIPNSIRLNRGTTEIAQLMSVSKRNNMTDIIILHEKRGEPNSIQICHLPYGPTAQLSLHNVVLRHDIPQMKHSPEEYPHLILHELNSKLGKRIGDILRFLFPQGRTKTESRRVISLLNVNDFIAFRHHQYEMNKKKNETSSTVSSENVKLNEIGPRFDMKLFSIKNGTLDNLDLAPVEFALRPYMNSSKKKKLLSINEDD